MASKLSLAILVMLSTVLFSCSNGSSHLIFEGKLNNRFVTQIKGFVEQKPELMKRHDISQQEFIALTTVRASDLSAERQGKLKSLRNDLMTPNTQTLLQKIIPLAEIATYMENVYEGKVGGFISIAADMKELRTMKDIYWGLRLDYKDSKFKENGAGYAVIRFYPSNTDAIIIPYSPEMGGTTVADWPFGGGGFTTSTLGQGGFPEYKYSSGYYSPIEGAELYECTPTGNEILRSVFKGGKWMTAEGNLIETKSLGAKPITARYVTYKGHKLFLRGETTQGVHLFTSNETIAAELCMEVYEKGEYRLIVPASSID